MTDEPTQPTPKNRRIWWGLAVVVLLLLAALLPPFLNINRYRHRVAASISGSLGRPVRIDNVGFRILPTPGFTIQNFVVGENSAFGDEPFMRANTVTATLHVSSLWRGHLEFATISLEEPSVNLVRNAEGKWNVESILLQATQTANQLRTAPTDQRRAGDLPRFPYIEATQARFNIKLGAEKMPFSLTDAKFALWLSQPETWHVRMEAHPLRTDMNANDTGLMQLEGTFQRAATLEAIPLELTASWHKAQLGDVSHMLMGRNAGWRGTFNAETQVTGHFGTAQIDTKLHLDDLRRAEFEPERSLSLDAACATTALNNLHAFDNIRCTLPIGDGSIAMEGSIPDLRQPTHPTLKFTAQQISAAQLLEIARHATNRLAPGLTATGKIDGVFTYGTEALPANRKKTRTHISSAANPLWQGSASLPQLVLNIPGIAAPFTATNIHLHTIDGTATRHHIGLTGAVLEPIALALGGYSPATLDGTLHHNNYTLHLRGSVSESQLFALARAIPQFGDGITDVLPPATPSAQPLPIYIDATAQRFWSGMGMYAGSDSLSQSRETWTTTTQHKPRKY